MYNQPPNLPPTASASTGTGLATASLVLGIIALVSSLFVIGGLLGIIGLIVGAIYLGRKRRPRGMALWGISLSMVSIIASIAFGGLYYYGYKQVRGFMEEIDTMVESSSSPEHWEGVVAPDITVTTLDGEAIELSKLKGKRVVLDFWATWCGPCVKEIPHFIQLHNETSRDELVIVGISKEDVSTLEPFIKKHGINYPIVSESELPSPYGDVEALPTTFFIDRNGVIQSVLVGYHDYKSLREHAMAEDFQGEAADAPLGAPSELVERETQLQPVQIWSQAGVSGAAICYGDWDGDNVNDILVAGSDRKLRVFDLQGKEKDSITLPRPFSTIEVGNSKGELRLLGYTRWEQQVIAMDKKGKQLWEFESMFGLNGAHWGDLDGDGDDEMIVGLNGFSGLYALTPKGKTLWKVRLGNVWDQAVVSAKGDSPGFVLATEAGGSVKIYDANGKLLRTARPHDEYFTKISAVRLDDDTIQCIAGDDLIAAFDADGNVAWSTPGQQKPGSDEQAFAVGDADGDGTADWMFYEPGGDLVVVSSTGEKFASVTGKGEIPFMLVTDETGKAILVLLDGSSLEAYRFE